MPRASAARLSLLVGAVRSATMLLMMITIVSRLLSRLPGREHYGCFAVAATVDIPLTAARIARRGGRLRARSEAPVLPWGVERDG